MRKIKYILIFILIINRLFSEKYELNWSEPINLIQLNSFEDDFAPQWNNFTKFLYFNSNREKKSNFYLSEITENNDFSIPVFAANGLNQDDNNSYIAFLSNDEALISSFQQYKRRAYQNIFQIYEKRKEWTKPVFIESLGFEGFVSHPTISPSGKILVFSTNRESPKNDLNLWIAYRQENGTFNNLSPIKEINTNGDEITPFFASDDTLFFSSNGQEGPGGFDLFYSVLKDGFWTQPIPLSELNTKFNESDFIVLPNRTCVFSSDRPGGKGKLDLYSSKLSIKKILDRQLESDIELSIATQVSSIKMKYELVYKSYIINPVFVSDPKFSKLYEDLIENNNLDTLQIKPDLADVVKNTFSIIGQRLKGNFTALLTIKVNKNFEKDYSEKIKNLLVEKFEIAQSRILIQKEEMFNEIMMQLESNDKTLFAPINIGTTEFGFEPKFLEILLNARPVSDIKSWDLLLYGISSTLIERGKSLPFQINLDLQKFKYQLLNLDSITLVLNTEDKENLFSLKKSVINISQSESRRKDLLKIGKKYYEQLSIFIPQKFNPESDIFSGVFKYLNENTKPNNPILILDNSEIQDKSSIFKDWLMVNFHSKNIQMINNIDINSKISNQLIRDNNLTILIEKGDF